MTSELESRRRALMIFYRRYLAADRAWRVAQNDALSWFPPRRRPSVPLIGDPGSRLRRLHDRRERALAHLAWAHEKLHETKDGAIRRIRILALPLA